MLENMLKNPFFDQRLQKGFPSWSGRLPRDIQPYWLMRFKMLDPISAPSIYHAQTFAMLLSVYDIH